ncbi:unnamed protein product [marine sediment metagenome]|uniref:Lysine biosynthesis protein LysW n=1 Tax=marine sediment metagenome TaxID=412755 RepID=X1DT09_9ZZZZ
MTVAICPDCDAQVEVLEDVLVGEILSCPDCGLDLEVKEIKKNRVEIERIAIEMEDWGE